MKKPNVLHVAIDSSVLREDRGLNKKDMAYLKELAKLKVVKIHIPWFVYKECTTTNVIDLVRELDGAHKQLSNPAKKGLHPDDEIHFEKIRNAIDKAKGLVQNSVEAVWEDFVKETDSILYPFDPTESIKVFDSYFTGDLPFRSQKAREDIPDAFIFGTIQKIAKANHLHFICKDKGLRSSAESIKNVFGYPSFDDFFNSTTFEPVERYYQGYGQNELKRLEFLPFVPSVSDTLTTEIEKWPEFELYIDYPYSNDEMISINSLYGIEVKILKEDIKFIGGEFYIDVVIRGNASIEYFIDKSVAAWMEERKGICLSDWNDYVFLAEEEEVGFTIRHTLILPEEYLQNELDINLHPNDVEDELEFDHLKEERIKKRWRKTDI